MNIADADGRWKLTPGMIENRRTREIRPVRGMPSAETIAQMEYHKFMRLCREAFATGQWPAK